VSLDLELRATLAEIGRAGAALNAWCAAKAIPGGVAHDLALILDELLANVVKHGYPGEPTGWIAVHVERVGGEQVRLEVRDRAPAFDPRGAPAPELSLPLDRRPIGGLGVHLIRTLARSVEYTRAGDENRLTLIIGAP
jgi:serine/threonine-protein kinase RsbW